MSEESAFFSYIGKHYKFFSGLIILQAVLVAIAEVSYIVQAIATENIIYSIEIAGIVVGLINVLISIVIRIDLNTEAILGDAFYFSITLRGMVIVPLLLSCISIVLFIYPFLVTLWLF